MSRFHRIVRVLAISALSLALGLMLSACGRRGPLEMPPGVAMTPQGPVQLDAGRPVPTNSALTFADGIAVRVPSEDALAIMRRGMGGLIEVSDDAIAEAIRILYTDTHTLAEGAGAAAFAALLRERERLKGKHVAVIVSGQNIDRPWMATVLGGGTPQPA